MSGARRNKILPKTAGHDADTAPVSSRRSLCLGPSSPTFEFLVHKDKFHALYGARDCSPLRLLSLVLLTVHPIICTLYTHGEQTL